MLHSCCSTFTCCQIYAHHIISLQQSLQDLHLVSNLNIAGSKYHLFLSEPAPLVAIPVPLCLGPHLISISGIIYLLSAAECIPLNLALYVHSTSLPPKKVQQGCVHTLQALTSKQPHWCPSVLPHQEALLYRCHIRYPSQLSLSAKLLFSV